MKITAFVLSLLFIAWAADSDPGLVLPGMVVMLLFAWGISDAFAVVMLILSLAWIGYIPGGLAS